MAYKPVSFKESHFADIAPPDKMSSSMTLEAIRRSDGRGLEILDQLLLPNRSEYIRVKGVDDAWKVIKAMNVRGAPAIAIVGVLALSEEVRAHRAEWAALPRPELDALICQKLVYLETSRPTAVNLKRSCDDIKALLKKNSSLSSPQLLDSLLEYGVKLFKEDVETNKAIGKFGAEHILNGKDASTNVRVLTHCNTGSLATAVYGTALGVIRALHDGGRLTKAFCTETRPYNQGSRLTAYELVYEKIPSCLVCDDMVGALMKGTKLDAVIVGADRVVRNGDTANKIGTYQLAVLAHAHGVPFYVACPTTTVDLEIQSGDGIPIEERKAEEMTRCGCERQENVAAKGISVWNPAFDITPASLITGGIITEFGVLTPPLGTKENLKAMKMK